MTGKDFKTEVDLGTVLDTYGADVVRWPQHIRARADALLAQDPQAERLLAEARALDALLGRAPVPAAERHAALAERIMAAAQRQHAAPAAARSGIVLPWPGAKRPHSRQASGRFNVAPAWGATALLAASLAVGVFVGALDLAPAPVHQLVQSVTDDDDAEQAVAAISNDGLAAALDEGAL
jgi:hypothetical protein